MCNSCANLYGNLRVFPAQNFMHFLLNLPPYVQNSPFPPAFPYFPTKLFTAFLPLVLSNVFHYSTTPTITTTKCLILIIIIERIVYENKSHSTQIK